MGPFELMDLVGVDVGLEIARSFFELSFHEPRWRPSPLQRRMVDAGHLGRKAGRGWYEYPDGRPVPRQEQSAPEPGGGDGLVVIAGELPVAIELAQLARDAGWRVAAPGDTDGEVPFIAIDAGGEETEPLQGAPRMLLCAEGTLAAQELGGPAVGFSAVPPLRAGGLLELTRGTGSSEATVAAAERFAGTLGLHVAWVGDAPGLVLARIVAPLVNEACFAIAEGVARAEDVDDGHGARPEPPARPARLGRRDGRRARRAGHRRPGRGHRDRPLRARTAAGRHAARGQDVPRLTSRSGAAQRSSSMTPPPFQRLLDAHAGDVLRFLVGAVGREDADDAFQETFLSALRAYPDLAHADNLRAWLFTIAHRKATDVHRARARRPVPVGRRGGAAGARAARRVGLGCRPRAAPTAARRSSAALRGRPAAP